MGCCGSAPAPAVPPTAAASDPAPRTAPASRAPASGSFIQGVDAPPTPPPATPRGATPTASFNSRATDPAQYSASANLLPPDVGDGDTDDGRQNGNGSGGGGAVPGSFDADNRMRLQTPSSEALQEARPPPSPPSPPLPSDVVDAGSVAQQHQQPHAGVPQLFPHVVLRVQLERASNLVPLSDTGTWYGPGCVKVHTCEFWRLPVQPFAGGVDILCVGVCALLLSCGTTDNAVLCCIQRRG